MYITIRQYPVGPAPNIQLLPPLAPTTLSTSPSPTTLVPTPSSLHTALRRAGGLPLASSVPRAGYVLEHVVYGTHMSDAPAIYHVGSALGVLATLVADRLIACVGDTPIPLHLWILLVGRSQLDRKTTSTKLTERLISELAPERLLPTEGSPEGLLEHLMTNGACGLLYYGEFDRLLSLLESRYWQHARGLLMDLYDKDNPTPLRRKLTSKIEGGKRTVQEMVVHSPRVSLLSACALSLLEHARPSDWTGGFYRRMLMLYNTRTRFQVFEDRSPVTERRLQQLLEQITAFAIAHEGRVVGYDDDARRLYCKWAIKHDIIALAAHPVIQGSLGDAPARVLRVAALYAISNLRLTVNLEDMRAALTLTELSCRTMKSVIQSVAQVGNDPLLRLQARVLQGVSQAGGTTTLRDLLRRLSTTREPLLRVLGSLEAAGYVRTAMQKPAHGSPSLVVYLVRDAR